MASVVVLLVATAGLTLDLARYAGATSGRLLPGTTLAGIDVGGMLPDEAHARVQDHLADRLERTVSLTHGGRTWTRSASELGVRSDLEAQLTVALDAAAVGWVDRARTRYLRHVPGPDLTVSLSDPMPGIRAWVSDLGYDLDVEPTDAAVDYDDRRLEVLPHRLGRRVDQAAASAAVHGALTGEDDAPATIALPVDALTPAVTVDEFDQILFLDQSDHRLDLYLDGRRTRSYTVATGTGRYPTPTGEFEVTLKRYRPTWVNPAPTGWGRGMPRSIGPGPNNPLGLRALNWSVGAIRFHGTAAVDSLGRDASHGCVRLSNPDIIELYDLVDEGARIISVR